MDRLQNLSAALLDWYDRCAREMPWRGIHDSYRTWVSETMLQQTRVETVIPYYNRFLSRFPSLPCLAAADEAEVLKLWEGLGYYSRARNLLKGARQVMEQYGGVLPDDPALLRKISGIGPYTAGAIASIAYDIPVPAVDGNVLRVYSRVFGIRSCLGEPATRKRLESVAADAVPSLRAGDYNQAVMDLGATVCIPGTPECAVCPLSFMCSAFAAGDAAELPVLPRSVPQKVVHWTVPVIRSGSRVLVRRRNESLLRGLWCFPLLECDPADVCSAVKKQLRLAGACLIDSGPLHVRHVFTHLIWEMTVIPLEVSGNLPAPGDYRWVSLQELNALPFPTAMSIPLREAEKLLL